MSGWSGARSSAAPRCSSARTRPLSAHRRGILLIASAAICWSSGGLIARLVATDGWTTVFWRSCFCALFLLAVIALGARGRIRPVFRAMGLPGVAMGLCFAAASTCFIMALRRTSVANVLIIHSTAPFIAGLIGWLWLGERVAPRTWVAMTVALGGTALMVSASFGRRALAGDALAIVTALGFAMATVIMRRRQHLRMLPAACMAATFAGAFAFPHAAPATAGARDLALLALFGVGQLGLGLILYTAGARLLPAAEAALIAVLETVLGPIWVWLAVGESPGPLSLAGGAVVLGALAVHTALDLGRSGTRAACPGGRSG